MSASSDYLSTLTALSGEKARAQAQAASSNANLWGSTIANIGQMVSQYPEQQAKLKEIANRADLTRLERDRETRAAATEQRNVQAQQQAAQVLSKMKKTPDGLWDTTDLMQQLAPTGVDPQHIESLTSGFEKMNDMVIAGRKRQEDTNADLAHGLLSIYTKDEPITSDSLSFNAEALKALPGGLSEADAQAIHDLGTKVPPGTDLRPLLKSIEQKKKEYQPVYKTGAPGSTIYEEHTGATAGTLPARPPTPQKVETLDAAGNPVTQFVTPEVGASFPRPATATGAGSDFDQYLAQVAKERGIPVGNLTAADRLAARKAYGDAGRQVIQISPTMQLEQSNAKTVAQGIKNGTVSPEVLLSSRSTAQGMALQAELEKLGVDGNKLTREWTATKRALTSLNSSQQVRLAEVINKASESLDKVEELNKQWSQNASRWGVKVLNRAQLKLAQNGTYGPEAQSVAQRLDAQIADVTSELAQGIMGGNSPTDHAFELAKKNLSSDWTQKVLEDSIGQARYNLNLAQNARNDLLEKLGVQSTQVQTPPPASTTTPAAPKVNPFR